MLDKLKGARIGIALTGSFCTLGKVFDALPTLVEAGARLTPILSFSVESLDTRFFTAQQVRRQIEQICGVPALTTIPQVEPIGPGRLLDLLIVAPCTGNTCAKLALGIADTPVTMACKSHLRNGRPLLIGLSSNDGLAGAAPNIGALLGRKHVYFVPYGQDDPVNKPTSLVLDPGQLAQAAQAALEDRQLQPLLVRP